jgi:peptide/nickel transport system substrate-binding protein
MNHRKLKVLRVLLPSLVLLALIAGCAPASTQEAVSEEAAPEIAAPATAAPAEDPVEAPEEEIMEEALSKTLIMAKNLEFVSFDPHICYEWDCTMVIHSAYETLITWDGDDFTAPVGLVADSWDISADGLTYTFQLREDVTFASGRNLTAADVKFSYDRLLNKQGPVAWYMSYVNSINVLDDYTVEVSLDAPNAALLSILTSPAFGILDSEAVIAQGGTSEVGADTTDQASTWLDQNSAGSGPFILTGWVPGEEITVEQNANYWGTLPFFEDIIIKPVSDLETMRQMLEQGDIDIAMNLGPDMISQIQGRPWGEVVQGNKLQTMYLGLSPDPERNEALANKQVRQAIAYAIDYDGIIELMAGAARIIPSMLPIGFIGVDQTMNDMVEEQFGQRYDPEKAMRLLEESGFEDVSFVLNYRNIEPDRTVLAKIQSDLGASGINVVLNPLIPGNFWSAYRGGLAEAVYSLWGPDYVSPDNWAQVFASGEGTAAQRLNYNPTFSELPNAAIATSDIDIRTEVYRDIQLQLLDDAVFIGIMQEETVDAFGPDIKDYKVIAPWLVNLFDLYRE